MDMAMQIRKKTKGYQEQILMRQSATLKGTKKLIVKIKQRLSINKECMNCYLIDIIYIYKTDKCYKN